MVLDASSNCIQHDGMHDGGWMRHRIAFQALTFCAVFSMLSGAVTYRGRCGSYRYEIGPIQGAGPTAGPLAPTQLNGKQLIDLLGCILETFTLRSDNAGGMTAGQLRKERDESVWWKCLLPALLVWFLRNGTRYVIHDSLLMAPSSAGNPRDMMGSGDNGGVSSRYM